ncbi:MAG: halocarboxylic acid dehydrogenase DehI family protein, partial [Halobacteriales archaeon]|nr:halocarboxylic acid dehydrogenase DehI family protein [Halobacteriales archaeon]
MDTSRQLALADATGWERGLYEDLMATFRAPIVNWIIRTLTANEPAFMRYLWGQVKPIFDTRGFATVAVTYRDTILSGIAGDSDLSPIDRTTLDLAPETYRDLQGQVATFDIVAPRLAVLFAVLDRGLSGESLGSAFPGDADRSVTAPYPDGLDSGRGLPPRLLDADEI